MRFKILYWKLIAWRLRSQWRHDHQCGHLYLGTALHLVKEGLVTDFLLGYGAPLMLFFPSGKMHDYDQRLMNYICNIKPDPIKWNDDTVTPEDILNEFNNPFVNINTIIYKYAAKMFQWREYLIAKLGILMKSLEYVPNQINYHVDTIHQLIIYLENQPIIKMKNREQILL